MSVRIHELAKRIGMDNKELLALLKGRGFDVKTVSSTVDPISAEALESELKEQRAGAAPAEPAAPEATPAEPLPAPAEPAAPAFATKLPQGVFVRSATDIAQEKAEAEKAKQAARVIAPPPAPVSPARPSSFPTPPPRAHAPVPPPPPVSRPPSVAPVPVAPPRPASPAPLAPPPAAPRAVAPVPAPAVSPVVPAPRPVSPAPLAPPPAAPRPAAPQPLAPPSLAVPPKPGPVAAPVPPPIPTAAPAASSATVTVSGDVKILHVKPPIIVRDFAIAIGVKPFRLISELMEMGIFGSLNQAIEEAVAMKVAEKHGFLLEVKHRGDAAPVVPAKEKAKPVEEDESKFLEPRPPVVCILGHVDHGKTTLLDTIRKANVAAGEAGGITQHIGAYQIEHNGRKITFLDTPGHSAFNKMRARGANTTDIAILVVAADDGFMPQTDEALKYIKAAKVATIVAVNKSDVKGANFDRVKLQMQERGIAPEDWGGETIAVKVSGLKGDGVPDLLEYILLQADVMELKANPKAPASGSIIEAQVEVGRGSTATVIVQRGTLRVGDSVVCGPAFTKIKALFNDKGEQVKQAGPSMPVKIIGWSATPEAGMQFKVVKNDREAKAMAEEAEEALRKQAVVAASAPKDTSVEKLFAEIAATQKPTLKVVVKSDVFGSAEAVRNILENIKSDKVALEVIASEVGLVTKNDVLMASAAGAIIIGFNTRLENGVTPLAKHHGVGIQEYDIIYELADKVKESMADLLPPDLKEVKLGGAEVRAVFPVAKGVVAGCLVTDGKITRNAKARVRRGREIVHESTVDTLRRFKDDANEVRAGLECGIGLAGYFDYKPGDVIECFEVQKIRASL
ncbi:MAG TPA: translation initiation factor IF-2 [Opitutaceae bacterium]|nr:translation initiation factor IF-2 [Opitutaceae bacterium]